MSVCQIKRCPNIVAPSAKNLRLFYETGLRLCAEHRFDPEVVASSDDDWDEGGWDDPAAVAVFEELDLDDEADDEGPHEDSDEPYQPWIHNHETYGWNDEEC